jgi:rRNA maturation RNase YbeY
MDFPEPFDYKSHGIFFQILNIPFSLSNEDRIAAWLMSVINDEKHKAGEVYYYFCDDQYQLKINKEYLNHDNFTDIISFQYDKSEISGDIFISIERVKENAATFNTEFDIELRRVMVHGILHFMGYSDKTPASKIVMRAKEDEYLHIWDTKFS